MSLFEALQAGGFDYPSTEDANAVDAEGVSLGQRKNQLSRRLRLARKQNPRLRRADAMDSQSAASSHDGRNSAGSAAGFSADAQKDLQRLMMQQQASKRRAPSSMAARALQMKRDQADLGELSDDEASPYAAALYQQEEAAKKPRVAKFHPDFAPLFVPPVSSARNSSTPRNATDSAALEAPNMAAAMNSMHGMNMGMAGIGMPAAAGPVGQARPSSVAISSLTHSAQAVGLTLEQLAMTLASNTTSLAKVLAENAADDAQSKRMDLAMRVFETDLKAMYSKAMLMGGFDPRDCQPGMPVYMQFARKAWKKEAKRLQTMAGSAADPGDFSFDDLDKAAQDGVARALTLDNTDKTTEDEHDHDHDHDLSYKSDLKPAAVGCDKNHVHRIDGQCGHKAIIHKPKNGNAHIDFVVGDKVECYHGIEPVGKHLDAAWPSRYKCKDAGEHGSCGIENCKELSDLGVPKVIELSDINLHDPEWNYDVTGSIDGGVAGLFRLGGRSDEASTIV